MLMGWDIIRTTNRVVWIRIYCCHLLCISRQSKSKALAPAIHWPIDSNTKQVMHCEWYFPFCCNCRYEGLLVLLAVGLMGNTDPQRPSERFHWSQCTDMGCPIKVKTYASNPECFAEIFKYAEQILYQSKTDNLLVALVWGAWNHPLQTEESWSCEHRHVGWCPKSDATQLRTTYKFPWAGRVRFIAVRKVGLY